VTFVLTLLSTVRVAAAEQNIMQDKMQDKVALGLRRTVE
jgi:hypothetical protein